MIPKIIHYCWFGQKPMPEAFAGYINGWKMVLPDYDFVQWDESNSPMHLPYIANAIKENNWANVSNLVRLWAIYTRGGIYLDTDVQLLKNPDGLLGLRCFFGKEKGRKRIYVNNAVMGAEAGHWFIKKCWIDLLYQYDGTEKANLSSPVLTTRLLEEIELIPNDEAQQIEDIYLFPSTVFHPRSWFDPEPAVISNDTLGIHHYAKTWGDDGQTTNATWFKNWMASVKNPFKKWQGSTMDRQLLREKIVNDGPFKGIKYSRTQAYGSSVLPKLTGSYEACLHVIWFEFLLNDYTNIIHLGAGEGYYVNGMQRLFRPEFGSIAVECDVRNVALLKENLLVNGFEDRVTIINEKATASHLKQWGGSGRKLWICDIEGDEKNLFTSASIQHLAESDLVIELHEFMDRGLVDHISSVFSHSHSIQLVQENVMDPVSKRFLASSQEAANALKCLDEGRPELMRWAVIRSRKFI
ncbi:MAG TPA: glycosyltransferase [Saprospiraceae bacterium]|nr:glycosyltransferase [Saprospiraceae bacterium]